MNILLEEFPTQVKVGSKIYDINTDFRVCLNIIIICSDSSLTENEKYDFLRENLYKKMPNDIVEATRIGVKFLNCGEEIEQSVNTNDSIDSDNKDVILPKYYDFEKDAKHIYNAFKRTNNIDLETIKYLHFWKFVYLFMELDQNCFFSQLVNLRRKCYEGKLTKEERILYYSRDFRPIVDLYYTDEPEETEFERLLREGNNNGMD